MLYELLDRSSDTSDFQQLLFTEWAVAILPFTEA